MNPDAQMERAIGIALRTGMTSSSVCLALGLLLSLGGASPRLAHLLLSVGLVVLLATPVSRVVIAVVEYLRERDWIFAALTVVVLLELLAGVFASVR